MEFLPPPLRWFLLCLLSGPILFVPLDEFRWMELICLEMMEFHVGPWWGKIAVFIESLPPPLITWDGSNGPFDLEFPALTCLVVQTNDDCLVGEVSSSVV